MSSDGMSATAAELTAAAEAIGSYHRRIGALVRPHLGHERDDLVTAIYEAERALKSAERAVQRARRIAER